MREPANEDTDRRDGERMGWTTALLTALLLLVLAGVWRLVPDNRSANQKQFDSIRVGMTEAEVEAVMSCPRGDYRSVRLGTICVGACCSNSSSSIWPARQFGLLVP